VLSQIEHRVHFRFMPAILLTVICDRMFGAGARWHGFPPARRFRHLKPLAAGHVLSRLGITFAILRGQCVAVAGQSLRPVGDVRMAGQRLSVPGPRRRRDRVRSQGGRSGALHPSTPVLEQEAGRAKTSGFLAHLEVTMARRPVHKRGEFLVGGAHRADDPRRSKIVKGMRMVSTPAPARLPQQYAEFEGAAEVANQLGAEEKLPLLKQDQSAFIAEMAARFLKVREGLNAVANRRS
jgi:hypothetical protein